MNDDRRNTPQVAEAMSERLITIAELLGSDGEKKLRTADVGCDHGYVSIYLAQSGAAEFCVAMDVREGPLACAKENIREYGLDGKIVTRLSDGLRELNPDEVNSLVIAGMGGKLMMKIISEGRVRECGIKTAVFQPQSDLEEFRQFVRDSGFEIADEKIVYEDGKYYFPMKVNITRGEAKTAFEKAADAVFAGETDFSEKDRIRILNRYGECNLLKKAPLLTAFLTHGKEVCENILKGLDADHAGRKKEIEQELCDISFALKYLSK